MCSFGELKGCTLESIDGAEQGSEWIEFKTDKGVCYILCHVEDCCESVSVEDVCGHIEDLIGSEILVAEEVTNDQENPDGVPVPECQDCWTWTFYKLSTIKGSVTIRWYGESNGYYSQAAAFYNADDGRYH